MARKLACCLLLLSAVMVCQSQSLPGAQASSESGAPAQQPIQELQEKAAANDQIQSNLQSALDDDPILSGASVEAMVNDRSIILTGTVESYRQQQRVLQLVSTYRRSRKIVNKISVQ